MEIYTIRLRDRYSDVHVLAVSFSQLCEHYLPSRHRNENQRLTERRFWNKEDSIEGPMGNVRLL